MGKACSLKQVGGEMVRQNQQAIANSLSKEPAIRPAGAADCSDIARVFMESSEHHASLDPELFFVPDLAIVKERYREGHQHPSGKEDECVTLVAEFEGKVVGFVDARLDRPSDPMHREMVFCHVVELAVGRKFQSRGIGAQLLQAAEQWGHQRGAHIALLEHNQANSKASAFYRLRMGYRVTSITLIKKL
jgi:ribosomal protein S18 acetylase RimI-like enzyme